MIKREAINLFLKSNMLSLNECNNANDQAELFVKFLNRLHCQNMITIEQLKKWC